MERKILVIIFCTIFITSSCTSVFGIKIQTDENKDLIQNQIEKEVFFEEEIIVEFANSEFNKKTFDLDNSDIMALNPLKYKIETNELSGSKTMPFCLVANGNKLWIGGRAYVDGTWDTYVCMFSISGSEPKLVWHRTLDYEGYDDTIRGIVYSSGYVYVVGHSTKGKGSLLLLKYDSDTGEYITGISSGSTSNPTVGTAIKYYDGYIYVSGSKKHDDGLYRVLIRKYSTNLDFQWGYYINAFEGGPEYGYDMDIYEGYSYITGVCNYPGHEFQLYPFMVKFNVKSEKSEWCKTYGMAWWSQVAQSCVRSGSKIYYTGIDMGKAASMDIMHSYIRDSDGWEDGTVDRYWGGYYDDDLGYDLVEYGGSLYTAGSTESYNAKAFDAVLLKTDKSFNENWYKLWGGSSDEEAYAVCEYNANIYTTGYTTSYGSASISAFLLKYTNGGSFVWDKVWCYENHPPNKPSTPSGTSSGSADSTYSYSTSTIDLEGDKIYYWFDWGDGKNSGWIGPCSTGETAKASHSWSKGSYSLRVKAKDSKGAQSEWSEYKSVSMPKTNALLKICGSKTFFYFNPIIFLQFGQTNKYFFSVPVYLIP